MWGGEGEIVKLKKSASKVTFTAGKFLLYNLVIYIFNTAFWIFCIQCHVF